MDSIVTRLVGEHKERAKAGLAKYGTDLDRSDLTVLDWLIHLRQELMDGALYALRLESDLKSLMAIVSGFVRGVTIAKQRYKGRDLEAELARLAEVFYMSVEDDRFR